MVIEIANALKAVIDPIGFYERLGGLMVQAPFKNSEGKVRILPSPADSTTVADGHWTPDNQIGPIGYFIDPNGVTWKKVSSKGVEMSFKLRFLSWHDSRGHANFSTGSVAQMRIIEKLAAIRKTPPALLDIGIYDFQVERLDLVPKTPDIFPFDFSEQAYRGLFNFPYDYFGLSITGSFTLRCPADADLTWTKPAC